MDNDRIPTQTQFTFAPRDATPEEVKAWHESEGKWWADRAMITVAIASFTQVFMFSLMLLSFWGLDKLFGH